MLVSGADIIIRYLEEIGIDLIFGIPGGANLPLYDRLAKSSIQHILARHEQGAAFMAQGYARSTGRVAVCFASSGPGVTNLLTGIADAKMDSIPIVAITGQVPLSLIGTDAFQEIDTYGLTLPITKQTYLVKSPEELFHILSEAFSIATSKRPGPVVIDVPKNIQNEKTLSKNFSSQKIKKVQSDFDLTRLEEVAYVIESSSKPILYVGGGMIQSNASPLLMELSEKQSIPIVSTLMGLSSIPFDNPFNLGMLGMHGAPYTNYLLEECDLLIGLGVRFDDRATGKVEEFCKNAKIIHVDIDASEIGKIKNPNYSFVGDVREFLEKINPLISRKPRNNWMDRVEECKNAYPLSKISLSKNNPYRIIEMIGESVNEDTIITTDVGQHQMWVSQCYPFKKTRTWLTSGGLGTMGFGIPAAIGAAFANPEKCVICFTGDGSILMNIQELDVISEYNLNIKIILLNNNHLGLVRQQQELFYKENFIASKYHKPADFVKISKAFGIESDSLEENQSDYSGILNRLNQKGAYLLNIPIVAEEKVLPMVPAGAANRDMILKEKISMT